MNLIRPRASLSAWLPDFPPPFFSLLRALMTTPIQFAGEETSNAVRQTITRQEPLALRTFTPSQMVLARSAGVFHWTPEGRRLYDYSSGVLVSNLGHIPTRWMLRFSMYM